jgi:hypothetical protein
MNWALVGAVVALFGGFAAANAFRLKRDRDRTDRRLAMKDEASRQGHFRGRADVELGDTQLNKDR